MGAGGVENALRWYIGQRAGLVEQTWCLASNSRLAGNVLALSCRGQTFSGPQQSKTRTDGGLRNTSGIDMSVPRNGTEQNNMRRRAVRTEPRACGTRNLQVTRCRWLTWAFSAGTRNNRAMESRLKFCRVCSALLEQRYAVTYCYDFEQIAVGIAGGYMRFDMTIILNKYCLRQVARNRTCRRNMR